MAPRTPIWKSISASLINDLGTGLYVPGDKLPTEAALAKRFGVNRHTVRHALAELAAEGLVHARRGAGVFVTSTPTLYPIGKRVRYHQSLRAAGRTPAKKVLMLDTRPARQDEADALALGAGADVHVYEGISLSDGQPIALFRSAFPAARFPHLLRHLQEDASVTAALAQEGVQDYTRTQTRLTAKLATALQAMHLRIDENAPILRSVGLNADPAGTPIEVGHTWFAGDRVTLTLDDL